MTVTAKQSGLDVFKSAPPGTTTSGRVRSAAQLQDMLGRGLACKLSNGDIAAVGTAADLNFWIAAAKAAYSKGTPEDSGTLRAFLTRRAAALGLSHLIGSWSVATVNEAGKSAPARWNDDRVARETSGAVHAVAKAAGCTVRSMDIELITPVERAEASAAAFRYGRLAEQMPDRASADAYRQLAKQELRKAGLA